MKNFVLGVVTTLAVLVVASLAFLFCGFAEVRSDIPPSKLESRLMYNAFHASVRREAPNVSNPFPATDENLIAGAKFYFDDCSGCHGTPGKPFRGRGPVLFPPIPELPVVGTAFTEAQIVFVARHGIRRSGMFANPARVTDNTLWNLAAYIKRMNSLPPSVQPAIDKLAQGQ